MNNCASIFAAILCGQESMFSEGNCSLEAIHQTVKMVTFDCFSLAHCVQLFYFKVGSIKLGVFNFQTVASINGCIESLHL